MYTINLTQISLDEFAEIITTIDLLPGRRILLDNFPGVIERLKQNGVGYLAELQKMLHNKKRYAELADLLAVEFIQDHSLNAFYRKNQNQKLRLANGFFECQYCGSQKVRESDQCCPICGKDLQ